MPVYNIAGLLTEPYFKIIAFYYGTNSGFLTGIIFS